MGKRNLSEWAAIAEIVGTVAVVASLLLVAYNLGQNTKVLRASNDNVLYQMQDTILSAYVDDASLASIFIKQQKNEELTEVEYLRIWNQHFRDLNMWELAYIRHQEGLFPSDQWNAWNKAYSTQFTSEFPEEWWAETRIWFRDDFAIHVDAVYAKVRE